MTKEFKGNARLVPASAGCIEASELFGAKPVLAKDIGGERAEPGLGVDPAPSAREIAALAAGLAQIAKR